MSNLNLRTITNSFQDVRLASLASWKHAAEFSPRDSGGPYVVTQEGYDPGDYTMTPDEFVLGRSGKWLSLGQFYKLPVAERRTEFIFGTASEVMKVMEGLPAKAEVLSADAPSGAAAPEGEADDMSTALAAGKAAAGPASA
ncbi:MAG: hypothetical protein ACKVYV_13050 [Limisphaerales bacterium]